MMNTKKLTAALMAVVMLISMLSCVVFGASAAEANTLGGPISISTDIATGSGIAVSGKELPNKVLVVSSSWAGRTGTVSIKLGDTVYRATMGANAFYEISLAVAAAKANDTIYVAAGEYKETISVGVAELKIYGPYAGVSPNAAGDKAIDFADPNAMRPAAESMNADNADEAIITGRIHLLREGPQFTIDGCYLSGGANFYVTGGGLYRAGTYVQNCIVNVSSTRLFDFDRSKNPDIQFKNNRVLNGRDLIYTGGFMGAVCSDNYFNMAGYVLGISSVEDGSIGAAGIVENNYFEVCNGAFRYDRGATGYQTVLYSAIIRDNYVASCGSAYGFVENAFYGSGSLPGVNVQITGNTILNVHPDKAPFIFNYYPHQSNTTMFRHMININNNFIDIPAGTNLIESGMNGIINCSYNYYSSEMTPDRVVKYEEADLIMYPYYADPEMTVLVGDARIEQVNVGTATIDQDKLTVFVDMKGIALDTVNMSAALVVSEGCTWELYEDETLSTKVDNKILYFDGVKTERYIAVYNPDGQMSNVYTMTVEKEYGTEAKIVDILLDSTRVGAPEVLGTTYNYTLPSDLAFLKYDIKTSSGATYKLYSDSAMQNEITDTTGYIPSGGYTVYVWVVSEDKTMNAKYTLNFNRDYNAAYDPCVISLKAPENGSYMIRADRMDSTKLWMSYYCEKLIGGATFDFEVTAGATWALYKDAACTEKLSSAAELKEIALAPGANTFYLEVKDAAHTNVITFVVENLKLESDTTIDGIVGNSPTIVDNVITVSVGGTSFSAQFTTKSPYAVCKAYADPDKKVEVKYNSVLMNEEGSVRVIDQRSFSFDIAHATSIYYIECIAENGAVENYTLVLNKIVNAVTFADVDSDAWYAAYVKAATERGILVGETIGETSSFRPNDKTTRQEMAVVAARLLGINSGAFEEAVDLTKIYSDASSIAGWAAGYVKVCTALGIMNGGDGKFKPTANITRQEVMVMFARMLDLNGTTDLSAFTDSADVADWAKDGVEAVIAAGIIKGDNNRINPKANITRAELAAMIARV